MSHSAGTVHHFVPTSLYGYQPDSARFSFYLDAGGVFVLFLPRGQHVVVVETAESE